MIAFHETAVQLALEGDPKELDTLEKALQFQPNGYYFAPSYERYRLSGHTEGWDGYIRPLRLISRRQGIVLRGYRDTLLNLCEANEFDVDTKDLLARPFESLVLADIPDDCIEAPFKLDDYQRRCVHSWLVHGIGINQVTVAGGKTAMFGAAAWMIKQRYPEARFLYLTPSERLVRQVVREMRKFLPNFDVGQFGGGSDQRNAQDMVVCTVAMVYRHLDALIKTRWFRRFMAVLYDEVHHCGGKSSEQVLMQIPAYFRLGASDTAKDSDPRRQDKMIGYFGSFLNEVRAAPLIASGRLAMPHIYVEELKACRNRFAEVPFRPHPTSTAWCLVEGRWVKGRYLGPVYEQDDEGKTVYRKRRELRVENDEVIEEEVLEPVIESGSHRVEVEGTEYQIESRWCLLRRMYDEAIVRFKERNERIVAWTHHYSSQDLPTLVVCTRTLHIYLLEALLQKVMDPERIRICFGWASSRERDEAFDWFRATSGGVLISPLVKEGVSINEIRAGVVADYVGDIETANQIVGRFMRKKAGRDNFAELTWFHEVQHPVLRRASWRIIRAFSQVYGYLVYDAPPNSRRSRSRSWPKQLELFAERSAEPSAGGA